MVDMKMTPAQKSESMPQAVKMEGPSYPYGLQITLDQDSLAKLGIELPKVGGKLSFRAVGEVKSCHASENENGDKYASCNVQIMQMEIEKEDEADVKAIADRLYAGA